MIRALIGGNIEIRKCQLTGRSGTGPVLFGEACRIGGAIRLLESAITGEVHFSNCVSEAEFLVYRSTVQNPGRRAVTLDNASFKSSVQFIGDLNLGNAGRTIVEGDVAMIRSKIGGHLDCSGSHFLNPGGISLNADFATVVGNLSLRLGFRSEGELKFVGAQIGQNVSLDGGTFENLGNNKWCINGDSASISGDLLFYGGNRLKGHVSLRSTHCSGALAIAEGHSDNSFTLDLTNAKARTYVDQPASRPSWLSFDGFIYDEVRSWETWQGMITNPPTAEDWVSLLKKQQKEKHWSINPQTFDQLSLALQKAADVEGARYVQIAKNRHKGETAPALSSEWLWHWVGGTIIGYGYQPQRAFALSLIVVMVGTIFFSKARQHNLMVPTDSDAYKDGKEALPHNYPDFSPLIYSLEVFLPLIRLDQSSHWTICRDGSATLAWRNKSWAISARWIRRYQRCHIVCGWILTTLWLGALSGVVKN